MSTGTLDPLLPPQDPATTHRAGGEAAELACRAIDIVIAAAALVVLAPMLVAIAAIIRRDSPGPALFRQRRVGRHGHPFVVNKFRTMAVGAGDEAHRAFVHALIAGERPAGDGPGPRFKLATDPRITSFGRVLRRTSLDELPQLINVLRGEMSLVGPRPSIPYEVERYPATWHGRFAVPPGMTGLWQVSGRGELTVPEMIELDLEYVRRRSPALNLWILARTVPVVLSRRGAS